jgi:hypothetical protein
MDRPQCISPTNGTTEEIIYEHPDDPINILPSSSEPRIQRKVSFMSSPLALISFKDGPTAPFEKKRRPIVKLVKTQPRLNGKYAWVRAFYRTRDRYAVTLLESDVSTKGHPALLYFGWDELESLEHDESNVHTLFLPPSTIGHLSWLDITSLYLQYVALHKLSSPKLATWVQSIQQTIQQTTDALPPLSRGLFIVILLPWLLSILLRMYTDYQSQDSSIITSQNTQTIQAIPYSPSTPPTW